MLKIGDPAYRYEGDSFSGERGEHLCLTVYDVLRQTSRGFWVAPTWNRAAERFVLTGAKKSYVWPTIEEAQQSFLQRKTLEVAHLRRRLAGARRAQQLARGGKFSTFESDEVF
jgi:hypothetical protein